MQGSAVWDYYIEALSAGTEPCKSPPAAPLRMRKARSEICLATLHYQNRQADPSEDVKGMYELGGV